MRLYLMRHGQAMTKESDARRHLTEAGEAEVIEMARFAKRAMVSPEVIWHSGKARAKQTAEIVARTLGRSEVVLEQEGLMPDDATEPIAKAIETSNRETLMIAGHLPYLGRLVGRLVTGDENIPVAAFPTGGMVCLTNDNGPWQVMWAVNPGLAAGTSRECS